MSPRKEQIVKPEAEDAEILSPQKAALQKILVAFHCVDVNDNDYESKRYELFKNLYSENIRLLHSTAMEAAHYANAVTHSEAYFKRLMNEDPRLNGKDNGHTASVQSSNSQTPAPAGTLNANPTGKSKAVLDPASEEELKKLSPQEAALKRIQFEFEAVDIKDQEYESKRFELFKKYFDEHVRIMGSTPMEALQYTSAILRASAFYVRITEEDPRFNGLKIGNQPGGGTGPSFMSDNPTPKSTNTPLAKDQEKTRLEKEAGNAPTPPRNVDPMLAGWTSVMRNYIKFKDLRGAKDYAKKIVDKFPGTPEADEAKAVLQMSAIGSGQANKPVPDSKPTQPTVAPVNGPKAKAQASMMRNYLNAHQLDKAKEYAKKIVDSFPGTPEAEEASRILDLKD